MEVMKLKMRQIETMVCDILLSAAGAVSGIEIAKVI